MATSAVAWNLRYQPFPSSGPLGSNMNLDPRSLIQQIGLIQGSVYCYIVRTVEYNSGQFRQRGSAPNFQGGLITLCTCKWRMRTGKSEIDAWRGIWIAGIAGAETGYQARDHLFFLMRVENVFASHRDLWNWLSERAPEAAEAKVADKQRLGDVYRPTDLCEDPYDPRSYVSPRRDHVHHKSDENNRLEWYKDVDYCAYGRRPALLVGDPQESFLWNEPRIRVPFRVGRGSKIADLSQLLA